jgi:DNA-binding MarR family transcriptional regulator
MAACAISKVNLGQNDAPEPLTVSELATGLAVTSASATEMVGLENTGFAERQPHPTDRRKRFVALTPDGEQATRATYSDLGGQLHAISAQLRPNRQDGVAKFLSQVSADLACPSLPAGSTGPLSRG